MMNEIKQMQLDNFLGVYNISSFDAALRTGYKYLEEAKQLYADYVKNGGEFPEDNLNDMKKYALDNFERANRIVKGDIKHLPAACKKSTAYRKARAAYTVAIEELLAAIEAFEIEAAPAVEAAVVEAAVVDEAPAAVVEAAVVDEAPAAVVDEGSVVEAAVVEAAPAAVVDEVMAVIKAAPSPVANNSPVAWINSRLIRRWFVRRVGSHRSRLRRVNNRKCSAQQSTTSGIPP